ncbi:MAG: DUF547 domain-containing protein [Phycisphaerales bacterium]|nr:DUF547 domain-containing protein [Phycisphaerales bacterium]
MKNPQYYVTRASLLGCVVLLSGCGPRAVKITFSGEPGRLADYGLLLHRIVVDDRIDTAKLLGSRSLLDQYLAMAAHHGPESTPAQFPAKEHQQAYLINCHNAMMLHSMIGLAVDESIPERVPHNLGRRFEFMIDGVYRTASEVKTDVVSLAGADWRVRMALHTGRMDGPPLPRRVFLGDMLDAQLDHVTRQALRSEKVVRVDHGEIKRLLLWRGLFEIRRQLISDYERRFHTTGATMLNVIFEWCNRFQRETLNSAVGYPVDVMPVDHRVNSVGVPINVAAATMR